MAAQIVSLLPGGSIEYSYKPQIYWYLSFRCNLECQHCSVQSSPHIDTTKDLSTEEALQVVAQLKDARAAGVILTGGEPLMRNDFFTLHRALHAAKVPVAIETNGLLINSELIDTIQQSMSEGPRTTIAVSLDGGTAETHEWMRGKGTFERTLSKLRLLKDAGISFRVQCIVQKSSLESIPNLFGVARELLPNLDYLTFGFLHPVGRGLRIIDDKACSGADLRRAYDLLLQEVSTYNGRVAIKLPPALIPPEYVGRLFGGGTGCTCNTTCSFPTLGILPDGKVTVCAVTRKNAKAEYGNVRSKTLRAMCVEVGLDQVRSDYLDARLSGICSQCTFARTCKGGCRAYAFEENGDFFAPHPMCQSLADSGAFPSIYLKSHHEAIQRIGA